MRRWGIMAAIGALALGIVTPGRAQTPPTSAAAGQPDVVILVIQQAGQADAVDITYAHTVPHAQARRDLDALAQATGWAIGQSRITEGLAPVQQKMVMTSSAFSAPNVIRNETHTLPVEAFITAFRPYKRLTLIFSARPDFQFQGQRDYADNNVQIAVQQHGVVFTYQVRVLNPQFAHLTLPRAEVTAGVTPHRATPWAWLLGIPAAAAASGVLVYVLMARKPGPPPSLNTDALAEERTKIGTKG